VYRGVAFSLEGLAGVVAAQGELVWAAQLWGAAEALRETIHAPIPPVERAGYERSVAKARAHLGQQAFAAAWAEGRTMEPEQALAAIGRVPLAAQTPMQPSSASPTTSPASSPASLSAREVEVLRLVAQGMTNEQIAEHLMISLRIVNTRLTSIYGKIQVSSRSGATRYAMEHHLV
jgi:DNA-binding CsgD family transcriptional regulator